MTIMIGKWIISRRIMGIGLTYRFLSVPISEIIRIGAMPTDKVKVLQLISEATKRNELDDMYTGLSYSRSYSYNILKSMRSLSTPVIERLVATSYFSENPGVSTSLALELLKRNDQESKHFHLAPCVLVLSQDYERELASFIDFHTVSSYMSEITCVNNVHTEVMSSVFKIWIREKRYEFIANALVDIIEYGLKTVPLSPVMLGEAISTLCSNGYTMSAHNFLVIMDENLKTELLADINNHNCFNSYVAFIESLCCHHSNVSLVTQSLGELPITRVLLHNYAILEFYWTCIAPRRKKSYKSKDAEQLIRAVGSNRNEFCFIQLGIGVYYKVMDDTSTALRVCKKSARAAELLTDMGGVARQAVSLLNWKWGEQNYTSKKALVMKFLKDFNSTRINLLKVQNDRKQPYGRYDQSVENFYVGIIDAFCVEDNAEAYSDAVEAILNIALQMKSEKSEC